jgi:hypothetical protein
MSIFLTSLLRIVDPVERSHRLSTTAAFAETTKHANGIFATNESRNHMRPINIQLTHRTRSRAIANRALQSSIRHQYSMHRNVVKLPDQEVISMNTIHNQFMTREIISSFYSGYIHDDQDTLRTQHSGIRCG